LICGKIKGLLWSLKIKEKTMKETITEIENELKAEEIKEILIQFSVYLTYEQSTAIEAEIKKRKSINLPASFSSILREAFQNGFSSVCRDTETLISMRKGRN